ncbi:hypothetical protein LOK49_LG03G03532 [Camellia lanceoleosa]|uniref:Uncharacterized protein n=1 Tax=Camellia lanceoleosa TaxID=1840588 RepID=A0ACC0IAJ6_9ERIC|nr:hypothetical protein LOK49_LG03G03532 [Camellia lanceoleosa]
MQTLPLTQSSFCLSCSGNNSVCSSGNNSATLVLHPASSQDFFTVNLLYGTLTECDPKSPTMTAGPKCPFSSELQGSSENYIQMSVPRLCSYLPLSLSEDRLDSSLPTDFLIKCEDQSVEIGVEYLWTPSKCSKCKVFGSSAVIRHSTRHQSKDLTVILNSRRWHNKRWSVSRVGKRSIGRHGHKSMKSAEGDIKEFIYV